MKIVITLGGNALLRRGEVMSAENQQLNIKHACQSIVKVAKNHHVVLGHGNGPQVGLLALQSESYKAVPAYPFDILGAESQAMVGYMFAQELRNQLGGADVACVITQSIVDAKDPAFSNPTKFIGCVYSKEESEKIAKEKGWVMKEDGPYYRRVVPSPKPKKIVEMPVIRSLVDSGVMVISAGGGGVPVMEKDGRLIGLEAVIDKDFAGSILASELNADLLIIATDVEGVYVGWGTENQQMIKQISPKSLLEMGFAAGSMGPKVFAACEFVQKTGNTAIIGALENIEQMVAGKSGTIIKNEIEEVVFY